MGRKVIDLTGEKFGDLEVMYRITTACKENKASWMCRCRCQKWVVVRGDNLRSGRVKSCGCRKKKKTE